MLFWQHLAARWQQINTFYDCQGREVASWNPIAGVGQNKRSEPRTPPDNRCRIRREKERRLSRRTKIHLRCMRR
jgi:hypothetical protein